MGETSMNKHYKLAKMLTWMFLCLTPFFVGMGITTIIIGDVLWGVTDLIIAAGDVVLAVLFATKTGGSNG